MYNKIWINFIMYNRNNVLDQTLGWDQHLLLDINKHDKHDVIKDDIATVVYGDEHHEPWPSTDLDAGRWIRRRLSEQVHFVPTSSVGGAWFFWNGKVHEMDEAGQLDDKLAEAFANALKTAANRLKGYGKKSGLSDDDLKPLGAVTAYAAKLRSEAGLSRLRSRLRREFGVEKNFFDKDQQWAVMNDGRVIDLFDIEDGLTFLDPDPKRPVTRTLGTALTENARLGMETPLWTKSLNEWLPSKEEQKYLQMAAGAALLGRGNAKNIVTLVGVSNTGKSTYLNTIKSVFGGYEGQLPSTAIVQKYGGNTNFEQATARGIRLLWLSEPQNTRTDDAFLKNLAGGGEAITTSEKGKDSVSWKAQCVLHIASNHIPKISTDDDAIVQRMNIVAFNHVFKPGPQMTVGLEDQLFAKEAEGILMWIIMGAGLYIKNRMQIIVPESIKKRGQDNVVESSAPLRWLADVQAEGAYKVDSGIAQTKMAKPKDVYYDFQQWCTEKGEKVTPSQKQWLKEIEAFTGRTAPDKRPGGAARVWGLVHIPVGERALSALDDGDKFWTIVSGAQ